MNYLLDTHVIIWAIGKREKLSAKVINILKNADNRFYISQVSLFEIAIKLKVGKLVDIKTSFPDFVRAMYSSGYEMLPIKDEHFESYTVMDFDDSHRDPFDRYLLAAAHYEDLAIITKDEKFQLYKKSLDIIW